MDLKKAWSVLALMAGAGFAGCAETAPTTSTSTATNATAEAEPQELSAEDKTLVAAQKVCPVGGAELGSMGDPIKVRVKDRDVFLCCEHCKEALLGDPDKYLAKLDAAAAETPKDETPAASPGT